MMIDDSGKFLFVDVVDDDEDEEEDEEVTDDL